MNSTLPWRVCQAGQMATRHATEAEAHRVAAERSNVPNATSQVKPVTTVWVDSERATGHASKIATYEAGRQTGGKRYSARPARTAAA